MHINVFVVVPMSENNPLEKAKSNCFTSAIFTVKCSNMPGLWYDSEDPFAAMAISALRSLQVLLVLQQQMEEAKDEESRMMISLRSQSFRKRQSFSISTKASFHF